MTRRLNEIDSVSSGWTSAVVQLSSIRCAEIDDK